MKKSLLLGIMTAALSLTANAHEIGDYVYTHEGRFKITGENLVTNGSLATTDGWAATDGEAATTYFVYDSENQCFRSLANAMTNDIYLKLPSMEANADYIVSFQMKQETAAFPFATNDTTATSETVTPALQVAARNYLIVYGNTDDAANGITDYVKYSHGVQMSPDYTTYSFVVQGDGTIRNHYFRVAGLATDIYIKDIQVQEAEQVADLRQRENELLFIKTLLAAKTDWEETDNYNSLLEVIENVEAITDDSSQEELESALIDLETTLITDEGDGFLGGDVDDYLATCSEDTYWPDCTTQGRSITSHGDWILESSSRWGHYWNSNASQQPYLHLANYAYGLCQGTGNAYLSKTLKPGVYAFGLAGLSYTQFSSYYENRGLNLGNMTLYIKEAGEAGDTLARYYTRIGALDLSYAAVACKITEEGDYEIGWKFSQTSDDDSYFGDLSSNTYGGSGQFWYPQLYCKLEGYSAAELAYIETVREQITAAETALANAQALRDSTELYWCDAQMDSVINLYTPIVATYSALTDDEIYNGFVDPVVNIENQGYANMSDATDDLGNAIATYSAADTIDTNVVTPITDFCDNYSSANAVFSDLQSSIDLGNAYLAMSMYSTATGRDDLVSAISDGEATYAQYAAATTFTIGGDSTDYVAMVAAKETLDAVLETFTGTLPESSITNLIDIDFSNDAVEDSETGYYTITGTNGTMTLPSFATETPTATGSGASMPWELGVDNNGARDSATVLRIGEGEATVPFEMTTTENTVLRVSYDIYHSRVTGAVVGTYIYNSDAATDSLQGMSTNPYDKIFVYNPNNFTLDFTWSNTNDLVTCVEAYKAHIEYYIDFYKNVIYGVKSVREGDETTDEYEYKGGTPNTFGVFSTLTSSSSRFPARRCWFDNLKIDQIAVDANVTGVAGVVEAQNEVVAGNAIYNIAGQKVTSMVPGQVYIINGKKVIK